MKAEDRIEDKSTQEQLSLDDVRLDDLRLINSMLTEYSDKLETISTKIFNFQRRLTLFQVISPLIGGSLFYFVYLTMFLWIDKLISFYGISLFFFLLISIAIIYFWRFMEDIKRKIRESNKYGKRIALRLERLVQIGSQFYEISRLSEIDEVSAKTVSMYVYAKGSRTRKSSEILARIDLDFCLADAETALESFKNLDRNNK